MQITGLDYYPKDLKWAKNITSVTVNEHLHRPPAPLPQNQFLYSFLNTEPFPIEHSLLSDYNLWCSDEKLNPCTVCTHYKSLFSKSWCKTIHTRDLKCRQKRLNTAHFFMKLNYMLYNKESSYQLCKQTRQTYTVDITILQFPTTNIIMRPRDTISILKYCKILLVCYPIIQYSVQTPQLCQTSFIFFSSIAIL